MDISRSRELEYRISHRHNDGAWGEMREVALHHTSVDHDPERKWAGGGRLFRCTSCDEWAIVRKTDELGHPILEDEGA